MKHPGRSIFVVLLLAAFALVFLLQTGALAEKWRIVEDNDGCDENRWSREEYACEVREITIDADWSVITVDGGTNGGISVEGWNKDEICIRAKIKVWDRYEEDARDTLKEIEIKLNGETIQADGPRMKGNRRGWSVTAQRAPGTC